MKLRKEGEEHMAGRMEAALNHAWSTTPDEIVYNSVASMPARLEAVCDAQGWYTWF
jgi:hypothetical protein